MVGGAHYVAKQFGDASLFRIFLFTISPDSRTGLINSFAFIIVAVIHHVAEKVPANCGLRSAARYDPSSRKARCRPPGCHVKEHALIPAPPADPVDAVTLEPQNTFSIHRDGIIPPDKHGVTSQVRHSIPAWLAARIIPQNQYFILCYAAVTASWQLQSNRAARIPPDLVQITLAEYQILGTSENRDCVVWRGKTGGRVERKVALGQQRLDCGRCIQVWSNRSRRNSPKRHKHILAEGALECGCPLWNRDWMLLPPSSMLIADHAHVTLLLGPPPLKTERGTLRGRGE